ncbi:MAG: adenylate/guanylate cyclase domain-containing protein [Cyanobacteriota bacterium]
MYTLLSFILFNYHSFRFNMPVVWPVLIILVSSLTSFLWQYKTIYALKNEIDRLFGKFVSPQVKKLLLDDPTLINYEGQKKELTVLFSDLRGFTSISENCESSEIFSQLNQYMYEMVNIIINEYNGTLDKFMGDAIMAFWGDPIPQNNHAELAVKAAVRMTERLDELNHEWKKKNWPELNIGIGINTGEMLVGHLGGGIILDYTVIGDNVNIASRLESLNKEYSTSILITDSTYQQCKNIVNVNFVAERLVKGKSNLIKFFEILSLK